MTKETCLHESPYYVDQTTQGYCRKCGTYFAYDKDGKFGPIPAPVAAVAVSRLEKLAGEWDIRFPDLPSHGNPYASQRSMLEQLRALIKEGE